MDLYVPNLDYKLAKKDVDYKYSFFYMNFLKNFLVTNFINLISTFISILFVTLWLIFDHQHLLNSSVEEATILFLIALPISIFVILALVDIYTSVWTKKYHIDRINKKYKRLWYTSTYTIFIPILGVILRLYFLISLINMFKKKEEEINNSILEQF